MSLREDECETGGGVPSRGSAGAEGQLRGGRAPAIVEADIASGIYVSRSGRGMQPSEGAIVRSASIGTGPRLGPVRGRIDWQKRAGALPGARPLARDARLVPPLCVARASVPLGEAWLHEIKWDGFRLLAQTSDGRTRLRLRDGEDWSSRFPELVRALEALGVRDAWLDGELVAIDEHGLSDYEALKRAVRSGHTEALRYIAFDLPAVAGMDLTGVPLAERKRLLEQLIAAQTSTMLVYGRHIVGHGDRVFAASKRQGAEGIVSKRVDAPYASGRSGDWVKLRHEARREFVVVGYTQVKGSPSNRSHGPVVPDSLLVARPEGGVLRYAGRVSVGTDPTTSRELSARLTALASAAPAPVAGLPARARWVQPRLVVELAVRSPGRNGLLRQAILVRLREDKSADDLDPEEGTPRTAQQ